jgi:hypothetical protein
LDFLQILETYLNNGNSPHRTSRGRMLEWRLAATLRERCEGVSMDDRKRTILARRRK